MRANLLLASLSVTSVAARSPHAGSSRKLMLVIHGTKPKPSAETQQRHGAELIQHRPNNFGGTAGLW